MIKKMHLELIKDILKNIHKRKENKKMKKSEFLLNNKELKILVKALEKQLEENETQLKRDINYLEENLLINSLLNRLENKIEKE